MMLFLRYVTLGEDDAILISTDNGDASKQYFRYDFTLAAKVRDHSQTLYASGDCASAEGIGCGVDCDGGGSRSSLSPARTAPSWSGWHASA